MPFPVIFLWGAAAVAAGVGVKKGIDATSNFSKAKEIGDNAKEKFDNATSSLEKDRINTNTCLESLGKIKMNVFNTQIKHMIDVIMKEKDAHSTLYGYDEDVDVRIKEISIQVQKSLEVAKTVGTGAAAGTLAAFGTYGVVGVAATASTGTAIAGLSGAAATNATLAWLGGGSLAAGGFGMAGGMVALGGIVLAPLLFIGGFVLAGKAEQALTEARRYSADVDKEVKKMDIIKEALKGIRTAAAEQANMIRSMVEIFESVKVDSAKDRKAFKRMLDVGMALKELMTVPVLENGVANPNIVAECSGYLELGRRA